MPRLLVNPGTADVWEAELVPGPNILGRDAQSSVQLDHPSVSPAHAEILISEDGAVLRDLSSAKGTFVGEELVQRWRLRSGQEFRVGEVRVQFISTESGDAIPRTPVSATQVRPTPWPEKSFIAMAVGALGYPLNGDGLFLLVGGTLLYLVFQFLTSLASIVSIIIGVYSTGYVVAYLQSITTSSARGEKNMPDWPDISDWQQTFLSPVLQVVGIGLFCFGPALLVGAFASDNAGWRGPALISARVFGFVYLPMAFLAVTLFDSLTALNPLLIVPSIARVIGEYLVVLVVFCTLAGVQAIAGNLISISPRALAVVTNAASTFIGLYLAVVGARVLGLLYLARKNRLGWFANY
jgi:pSer/pThr/pTyr-binding forkhead associated (FHA) protein